MTKVPPPGPNETILHEIVRDAPGLRDSTKRTYLVDINAWVTFAGTDRQHWTRYTAQKFYAALLERMTVRSANRVMATLAYAGHWFATKEGNPQLDFSIIQKKAAEATLGHGHDSEADDGKALTVSEAQQLLAAIGAARQRDPQRTARDLAITVLGLETGMRRMSFESMLIQLTSKREGHEPLVTDVLLKGLPDRYPIALSATAVLALEPWLRFLREAKVTRGPVWRSLRAAGTRAPNTKPTVGAGFTAQAIYDMVLKYGGKAKVELTPHTFRHTFISWRLAAGWTPQQIAAITGHQLPRGIGDPIGAMRRYIDPRVFWPTVSTATPAWLTDFVRHYA